MANNKVTIKTNHSCVQAHEKIHKILAVVNAKNFAKLPGKVSLSSNPRRAKKNKITKAICETLDRVPDGMKFMSKGILLSTLNCQHNERGRFTLTFAEEQEGVLDGGHNLLAVGIYILEKYAERSGDQDIISCVGKIKTWEQFIEAWESYESDFGDMLDDFAFEMPIEIIYPAEGHESDFLDSVFDISDARNNNAELTLGTKANHRHEYQVLKDSLDPEISSMIEWTDNEIDKSIKRDDIVAMALIPFMALHESKMVGGIPGISPVNIYGSKTKCVEIFSKIYASHTDQDAEIVNREITNPLILSAMGLLKDLPRLYDLIYSKFPRAYNDNSQGFGRMKCVKMHTGERGEGLLRTVPKTKYYGKEMPGTPLRPSYKYPDSFIMPIFCSLHKLMKVSEDGKALVWKVDDPDAFIKSNLTECAKMLMSFIKGHAYDPTTFGKDIGTYNIIEIMFENQIHRLGMGGR